MLRWFFVGEQFQMFGASLGPRVANKRQRLRWPCLSVGATGQRGIPCLSAFALGEPRCGVSTLAIFPPRLPR
jgi:hypothetical protein